jgi:hypothetical protein
MGPLIVAVQNFANAPKKLLVTHINWSPNLHRIIKSAVYPTAYIYLYVAALDADRAPQMPRHGWGGGGGVYPNVQNTKICCVFLRTVYCSSAGRQNSGSLLRDLGITSLIIIVIIPIIELFYGREGCNRLSIILVQVTFNCCIIFLGISMMNTVALLTLLNCQRNPYARCM